MEGELQSGEASIIKKTGVLHIIEENMTGEIYSKEILREALFNSIQEMEIEVDEAVIIEDLDPKHSLRCNLSK